MDSDVLILGGGFAGLAAAHELQRQDYRVLILEARGEPGGRALTIPGTVPVAPLELGAEFVHGRPAITLELMRAAGTTDVDNGDESWLRDGAQLQPSTEDPFAIASALLARARERERDESVENLLSRIGNTNGTREAASWARALVGGFDAADPVRASARAIAAEWGGDASAESAQSRPLGGYGPLVTHLVRTLHPERSRLLTATVARTVHYGGRGVRIDAATSAGFETYTAQRAIVTLPLGVLQARAGIPGAIVFEPALPRDKQDALGMLVMGQVRKVILRFARPFWETLEGGRYRNAAFFHDRDGAFFAYWTQVPVRSPAIGAWAGGPAAQALETLDDDAVAAVALEGFGALLAAPERARAAYVGYVTHDWQRDEFFRGAYSYVAVGGEDAPAALARPVDGTLYFAGEATAAGGEVGTVAGALQSGVRAARELHDDARSAEPAARR